MRKGDAGTRALSRKPLSRTGKFGNFLYNSFRTLLLVNERKLRLELASSSCRSAELCCVGGLTLCCVGGLTRLGRFFVLSPVTFTVLRPTCTFHDFVAIKGWGANECQ